MKKALRISISILLFALAVAVTQIPAGSVSAETDKSTEADFQMKDSILVKYTGTAKVVSVPAYVTRIGDEAFLNHDEIEELQFAGDRLEEISYCAFSGCDGLTKVSLPDSLVTLGNGAFSGCSSLKEAHIGNNTKNIGIGCFANCPNLSTLSVSAKNPYLLVKDGCLYDDEVKKLYLVLPGRKNDFFNMPSTVEDVDAYAFWGSREIKSVGLGSKLTSIPDYAFSNCKALEEIIIPLSVRRIGIKAFEDCVHLKKVVIPVSVTDIHETAFDGCKRLEIFADEGTYAYRYYQNFLLKNEILGEEENEEIIHVEEAPPAVVSEYYDPDKDKILGGTFIVGNNAIVFLDKNKVNVSGEEKPDEDVPEQTEDLIEKNKDIPKYTVTDAGVIADYAYYKDKKLVSYDFDEGETKIGRFAFARSGLSKIRIPYEVTEIGYGAFYSCDRLSSVYIPASVKKIAPKAFDNTPWLEEWKKEDEEAFLIVGDGILLAYRGKESEVTIPDSVKIIGSYAFYGNHFISSVQIPDSVQSIEEYAFYDCAHLESIEGAAGVEKIADRAFKGCAFKEFTVPESVKEIGYQALSTEILRFPSTEELPKASYEDTATYLGEEMSEPFFDGVKWILLPEKSKASDLEDTVLDTDKNLLKGLILSVNEEDKRGDILYSGYTKEEYERITVPADITAGEEEITIKGASDVPLFFNGASDTDSVKVRSGSDFTGNVSANLDNAKGSYTVEIKDVTDYKEVQEAYNKVYRMKLPDKLHAVDISMVNDNTGTPVRYFGNYDVTFKMSIPDVYNNSSLRILTLDANGQLENVSYRRENNQIILAPKHLSVFVFYATEKESNLYGKGVISGNQTVITGYHKLDASPDTGDRMHPKYFAALALFALGVANLFVRRKRKAS